MAIKGKYNQMWVNIVKYIYIYICGTWGPFNNHSGPYCFSALLSPISIYMQKKSFVRVWEVLEDHLLNPRYQSVSELRPHHNGDICTSRKMTSSSYLGHDEIFLHFWIFGGHWQCLGEDFNNRIGPISVRIYHLIYVNLHVKLWKQSYKNSFH